MTPAVARARQFLVECIERTRARGDGRLPTVNELARQGGFSTRTVVSAVSTLRDEGILSVSQRAGIRVRQDASAPARAIHAPRGLPGKRTRWEQVGDAIAASITDGTLAPGADIPPVKRLRHQYGASHATVRKALRHLASTGKLVPVGRHYRVFDTEPLQGRGTIVFVTRATSILSLQTNTPASVSFWRAMERACDRRNVDIEVVREAQLLRGGAGRPGKQRPGRSVVGYIVWTLGFTPEDLDPLLHTLLGRDLPVAVVDEGYSIGSVTRAAHHPLCRVYTFGATECSGEIVGNFLLAAGHRRVACFQLSTDVPFCVNRVRGIEQAFADLGIAQGVVRLTLGEDVFRQHEEETAQRVQEFGDLWQRFQPPGRVPSGALSRAPEVHNRLWGLTMRRGMVPLFEQVLADPSITAWVAVNDVSGLAMLDYLAHREVRVPEDISVVSFDDSTEAFGEGLTSYDFNMPPLVEHVLNHILAPNRSAGPTDGAAVEIPGKVMVRRSAGRARVRWVTSRQ